jgi:hypothetical protein
VDCEIVNLVHQVRDGNRRPWVLEAVRELGHTPTDADIEAAKIDRRNKMELVRELGARLYRALLETGQAYTVVDHSDRLASRPFEIKPANLAYVSASFLTTHGSYVRLARYKTREAAEANAAKIMRQELERINNEEA